MNQHTESKGTFDFNIDELNAPKPRNNPSKYVIDPALESAVKVALLLKQPLLLTGKPGTGKTRLAEKLAYDLHAKFGDDYLEKPLTFHTKTVSTFTDLFYTYDALGHFHDANFNRNKTLTNAADHLQLQALGQAIVLTNEDYLKNGDQFCAYKTSADVHLNTPKNSVVLIDEVDKAPRDFTNDLLDELDRYRFSVKEDGGRTFVKGSKNIFVILTSNSEKNLPDAFLRRCIYYNIPAPSNDLLVEIVKSQLSFQNGKEGQNVKNIQNRITEYVNWFTKTVGGLNAEGEYEKGELNFKKEPATAELISWMYYLRNELLNDVPLSKVDPAKLAASYSILGKHEDDLKQMISTINTSLATMPA